MRRALPRLFYPSEPVFLLEGASRTFKHGADTRLSQDNTLVCRLSGFYVEAVSASMPSTTGANVLIFRPIAAADAVLDRSVETAAPDAADRCANWSFSIPQRR